MSKDSVEPRVKIVRPRITKFCICPFCKTKQRFKKVKELGINEVTCFIVDMWKSFPSAIHKVYPEAKIQYDYFHIWEAVNRHLDNAMKEYSRYLRYTGNPELAKRVWSYRRIFLKHPKRYIDKDKEKSKKVATNLAKFRS